MLLPAAVRPYAADVDGTDSRVRCAIVLNGSKELHIQLCGRLKRGLFGRNQLLADGDVLCVALHQPDGDVPLFDSRCDGYANVLDAAARADSPASGDLPKVPECGVSGGFVL